ncbi:MAG TPA: XdhC family protein [Nakamurella sp.]
MSRSDLDERAAQLRAAGEPFVRARVVLAHKPTSAKPGDEAIVHVDGSIEGFVGGTCAESTVRTQSLRLLTPAQGAPEPLLLRIRPDAAPGATADQGGTLTVHNPCLSGGALEIFLDPVVPPPLVLVHGDGPVAAAISRVTEAAGYRCGTAESVVGADAVVVASHGRDELAVLCAAIEAGVPYVGLVASTRRGAAVLAEIAADRPDLAPDLHGVDTPAGLDLGARTAGEIAISILASIVRTRATTTAPPHPGPAHPARIDYGGADHLPPDVPGVHEVNDVSRASGDDPRGTAVDPVCGMTVATVSASLHIDHDGRTVWFCGPGCRRAFQSDPARQPGSYVAGLSAPGPAVLNGGLASSADSVP